MRSLPNWDHDNEEWIMGDWETEQRENIADDPTCIWDYVAEHFAAADPINYDEVPF